MVAEGGIKQGLQYLQQCLLDESIQHRGDAQLALATVEFGNHDLAYRAGPVPAWQQRFADLGPIRAYGLGGLLYVHARSPCSTALSIRLLYIGSQFTIHASFPHSVTLMQLRFTSLTVTSSREDLHLRECAHAGRT